MKISTTRFGEIDAAEEKIITMPAGMPGFSDRKRYVIFDREEAYPLYWYQSVDDPSLAFIIINPYLFKPDYLVNMESVLKEMSWEGAGKEALKVYVVVNASNKTPEEITANLLGPIIINTQSNEAVQVVLYNSLYTHKYPIFSAAGSK